jgi:hypothetical protein
MMHTPDPQGLGSPGATAPPPRCSACRDVIGVYEPVMHVRDGMVTATSRASEPGILAAGGSIYHADCYARMEVTQP